MNGIVIEELNCIVSINKANLRDLIAANIDLARNGNSGCANEILGCANCHFWWKSPWKWKNWGNSRVCNLLHCLCKTQVHGWLAKTMAANGIVILLKLDSNHRFFNPCDLEIWWMTLKNNRAPLRCCFKLCASFHSHRWILTGVTARKR